MALPWVGVGLGLFGGWHLSRGDRSGWWMLSTGAALVIADVLIDFVWAHPPSRAATSPSSIAAAPNSSVAC